jgi:ribA/ribD-fused uncharacterized protein
MRRSLCQPRILRAMDRRDLIARVERGEVIEYLFFWGHKQSAKAIVDKSCLSQWFPASFEIDGVVYRTAEHWMMAGKARLFGDTASLAAILACEKPDEAKQLGRRVAPYDDAAWAAARYALVVEGNVAKFSQNEELGAFLHNTGERVLVEASPLDGVWGIGLGKDNPLAQDPRTWRGENLLGFALMEARSRIR